MMKLEERKLVQEFLFERWSWGEIHSSLRQIDARWCLCLRGKSQNRYYAVVTKETELFADDDDDDRRLGPTSPITIQPNKSSTGNWIKFAKQNELLQVIKHTWAAQYRCFMILSCIDWRRHLTEAAYVPCWGCRAGTWLDVSSAGRHFPCQKGRPTYMWRGPTPAASCRCSEMWSEAFEMLMWSPLSGCCHRPSPTCLFQSTHGCTSRHSKLAHK